MDSSDFRSPLNVVANSASHCATSSGDFLSGPILVDLMGYSSRTVTSHLFPPGALVVRSAGFLASAASVCSAALALACLRAAWACSRDLSTAACVAFCRALRVNKSLSVAPLPLKSAMSCLICARRRSPPASSVSASSAFIWCHSRLLLLGGMMSFSGWDFMRAASSRRFTPSGDSRSALRRSTLTLPPGLTTSRI